MSTAWIWTEGPTSAWVEEIRRLGSPAARKIQLRHNEFDLVTVMAGATGVDARSLWAKFPPGMKERFRRAGASVVPLDVPPGSEADLEATIATLEGVSGGAGSTAWEAAAIGRPQLLATMADNQHEVGESLHQAGAGSLICEHSELSPRRVEEAVREVYQDTARMEEMAVRGRSLVDGRGVESVGVLGWRPKG